MMSSATGLGVKETMKAEMIEVHVHANTEENVCSSCTTYMYFIYMYTGMQESK